MTFSFKNKLICLIVGSALIFSGCGTTSIDNEKYEPVVKETTNKEVVTKEVEEDSNEDTNSSGETTTVKPAASKPAPKIITAPQQGTTDQIPVTLVSTTDGDTIRVMYNGVDEPVRYLLIDTPETNHPRLGKQPFGPEAKERNRALVNSGKLTLEFDIGEKRDKYGRLLAYVYVDGKSVQEILIREGLARVAYAYPPNIRHLTLYEEAQKEAQSKRAGFWAVEDYATDSGFDSSSTTPSGSTGGGESSSTTGETSNSTGTTEWFENCTHLRTKYPNGVPSNHPAYQSKMDRDKDQFACER
ncbi:thermonuclease family protein [Paenisporosarcina sp. NPDC076898]|uniref:thermonuclease family protein n=1 Tax=unclassified Paenisporosarcina TaxID=2642018 RepID=UPI003D080AD8